ncbi:multicopper oxidase domain-containing protein [Paenibacillus lycopersici]|uniref:Multicopper oxidase domain-containing protein n=1 Tax=Paenibacillus lycopersici TaxID=2704462 RepID=A0A6C0G384_9BACL|nr:multicopper oxidase domain-containing protein [Paenibacillus lycopersici]QHT59195.1 multicopper oxidase domain-containing protein [Paenibacillus lycopersici]
MVESPDVPLLPYTLHHGVKCFELVAQPVSRELLPGLFMQGYGYNGMIPGPTIVVEPGDEVRIRVVNLLPEKTSVHWHGLDVPNAMDGVPDIEPTPLIQPGRYADYRFRIVNPPGTHMYHTHYETIRQEMMGLGGLFIIGDRHERGIDRDFAYMLQEFAVAGLPKGQLGPGAYAIDPLSDGFNFFTMNGRCFPHASPLHVRQGETVRIRLANLGMQGHPMHLHGVQMLETACDGNDIPPWNRQRRSTIFVAPGETRDVRFLAWNPGNWPFHCHIPHHNANNFTLPAGGMFTTVRVRRT